MSQHDFNIANQGFPATRADINNAFQAIASNSSGPTAPSTTYANQWWYDTTNDKMYLRNAADSAWIEVAVIDQTNNEWKITSGVIQAVDGDGIVLKTDDGITRFTLDDTGNVTFAEGTDIITGSAGTDNVRIGAGAGDSIASGGNYNVAVGTNALTTITTADNNTAIGHQAGYSNTTGADQFFGGYFSGYDNTTGASNVGVGSSSLRFNTTGSSNTALGATALFSNTTSSNNTAVGYQAGYSATTEGSSVYIGKEAGYNANGLFNTLVGTSSGLGVTSGVVNTFLGYDSGSSITTGSKNVIIGNYDGNEKGLDMRTSSNNIVLSDGDGSPMIQAGLYTEAVEAAQNTGSYDCVVLGKTGSNSTRATAVIVGDIFGATYAIRAGGYGLTFAKSVSSSGSTTPSSYANALQITASSGTDTTPDVHVTNTLSKGSGSFRIEHPLPSKSETHDLVHSFIEGPKADLIYRGKVDLVNGTASLNIDTEATMTDGTFEVLCRDVQCFTSNETGWTAVKGSVTGNILTIVAQENTCTDTISWMVVGERKDPKMRSSSLTDDDGNMIVEPLRRIEPEIDYENV